jgi:4-oxalocrotonate tautomerase
MPYVNIRITREGATAEQKARLIAGATQLLVDVLGKNPNTTVVVIDEIETDNWGWQASRSPSGGRAVPRDATVNRKFWSKLK